MGRPPKKNIDNKLKLVDSPKISCIKCGCSNQNNFYITKDIARKYFGKIPYCKDCIKEIYSNYLKKNSGNINMAIYFLCRKIDIPYIHSNYCGAIENINKSSSRIQGEDAIVSAYMKGLSFSEQNGWGFTFDESKGEDQIEGIASYEDITKVKRNINFSNKENEDYDIIEYDTEYLVRKWGLFSNEDLAYLESEYLDWEDKLNGITEKSTEIMVRQVCLQCNEIRKDREANINVEKKLKTLQDLLKTSGLIELQDSANEERSVGMLINDIEYKRPIKKADPEFEDIDNIKDILYGFIGAMCRTLGKENVYTEKFDEIYEKYSIDIIDSLKQAKEEEDTEKEKLGDENG